MILGIHGRAGAGKSTVADILVQEQGFTSVSLAEPLKSMLYTLNPDVAFPEIIISPYQSQIAGIAYWVDLLGWDAAKRCIPEIRRLLQVLGTDCIRAHEPDFWTRIAEYSIEKMASAGERVDDNGRKWLVPGTCGQWDALRVVVPDVRFENEAIWMHGLGGNVLRVHRESADEVEAQHASEQGFSSELVDIDIFNEATVDELRLTVRDIVEELL